jgi:glutathione synthase/RimK-type ligase-like ATP-grasp enzyme
MIYAHDDMSKWGVHFALACGRANVPCHLFTKPDQVPDGAAAFVRLNQMKEYREEGKRIVRILSDRGIPTLPNAFEAEMYDDKSKQSQLLKKWLPNTYYVSDLNEALTLAGRMKYPIISKSKDGASSAGVRLLKNEWQAVQEAKKAFTTGFRSVYNRLQKGYVIWQDFLEDNNCDYRVVITNDKLFGLKRNVRPDVPFASGSGDNEPILEMTDRAAAAFKLAIEISDTIQTKWMAYDFVFAEGKPYVLEMSSSWSAGPYHYAVMFDRSLNPTQYRGGHMFDEAVKVCQDILAA